MFSTQRAIAERIDYEKQKTGHWKATYRGLTEAVVEAPTLDRCRFDMLELLDKRLMEFVEKSARATARPARRQPAKRPMARRG